MEISVEDLAIVFITCVLHGSVTLANPCSSKNYTVTGSSNERCDGPIVPKDDGEVNDKGDYSEKISSITSETIYTVVIVLGVVIILVIILTRICWLRKLHRQRNAAMNEIRQIVDQRYQEEQRVRSRVYSIDLVNVPFEKPPSYEESLANPSTGCPPPYDQLPKEVVENGSLRSSSVGEQNIVSTSNNNG